MLQFWGTRYGKGYFSTHKTKVGSIFDLNVVRYNCHFLQIKFCTHSVCQQFHTTSLPWSKTGVFSHLIAVNQIDFAATKTESLPVGSVKCFSNRTMPTPILIEWRLDEKCFIYNLTFEYWYPIVPEWNVMAGNIILSWPSVTLLPLLLPLESLPVNLLCPGFPIFPEHRFLLLDR